MGAPARATGFPPVAAGGRRPEREVQEAGKAIEDPSRTVRQVLLNCVKPTQESILGELNAKDVITAVSLARDRIEWKS